MKGLSSLYRGLSGVEPTADDIGAVKKSGRHNDWCVNIKW
jgi:hypothetical protein